MKKDPKIFLHHILESIQYIEEYANGEYFDIDLFLTWKVVSHELPLVKQQIITILNS